MKNYDTRQTIAELKKHYEEGKSLLRNCSARNKGQDSKKEVDSITFELTLFDEESSSDNNRVTYKDCCEESFKIWYKDLGTLLRKHNEYVLLEKFPKDLIHKDAQSIESLFSTCLSDLNTGIEHIEKQLYIISPDSYEPESGILRFGDDIHMKFKNNQAVLLNALMSSYNSMGGMTWGDIYEKAEADKGQVLPDKKWKNKLYQARLNINKRFKRRCIEENDLILPFGSKKMDGHKINPRFLSH